MRGSNDSLPGGNRSDSDESHFDKAWTQYYEKLVRVARSRLGAASRRDADEEDVAASAMKSFYRGITAGRIPRLDDPDDLWKMLLTITVRKANKRVRYQTAERRGEGKVRGESVFNRDGDNGHAGIEQIIAAEPTPEFSEQVVTQCQDMLDQLEDDRLALIALMKFEGFTNEEIAAELDCAVRNVERKLFRIRLQWESLNSG